MGDLTGICELRGFRPEGKGCSKIDGLRHCAKRSTFRTGRYRDCVTGDFETLTEVVLANQTAAIFVSQVAFGTSPIGNDATGDGSAANPYLTLTKAMTVAVDGSVILLNGDPANPAVYAAPTIWTITKGIAIDSIVPFGATLTALTTTSRVVLINAPGKTITFGSITIDCQNLNTIGIEFSTAPVVLQTLNLNATRIVGYTIYGCSTAAANAYVQLNAINVAMASGPASCRGSIYLPLIVAGGVFIQGGSYTTTNDNNVVSAGMLTLHAVATGVSCTIRNAAINLNSIASLVAGVEAGIDLENVANAYIGYNSITMNVPGTSCKAISIAPTIVAGTPAASLNSGGFMIEGNTITGNSTGGYLIVIGYDGVGIATTGAVNANGLLNGGTIRHNSLFGSVAAATGAIHHVLNTCYANTKVYANRLTQGGVGLGDKEGSGIYFGNIVDGMTVGELIAKGSSGAKFIHNTVILRSVNNGAIYVETNPRDGQSSQVCLNVTMLGNNIYSTIAGPTLVQVDPLNITGLVLGYNNYYGPLAFTGNPWRYNGGSYANLEAYKTASGENTAAGYDPQFVNFAAGNVNLPQSSPLRFRVPGSLDAPTDYLDTPFSNPGTVGAYQ